MALTPDDADAHVTAWETELAKLGYPHRRHWPSRLFHHAPIENAVSILAAGLIRARSDPDNPLHRDIAGKGVIDTRDEAHGYVRFYFRPRTPTQFYIEGIRKAEECEEYGFQAPVLIMLVFDARAVLTRLGTRFSDENMQRSSALSGEDVEFFSTIPFAKVYHEGGLAGDRSIIAHRCAEVLALSPLHLSGTLQWIYCRSEAERDTLLFKLGDAATLWKKRIRVSDDIRVFNRLFTYVEHVHLSNDGIVFELHPRNDGKKIAIKVLVRDALGSQVALFEDNDFAPYPKTGKRWRTPAQLSPGIYEATIWLEKEEAYHAKLHLGDALI